MPARNSIKVYADGAFYHVYNRGVEQRKIFLDEQDFSVFLSYIATYLLPKDETQLRMILTSPSATWGEKDKALKLIHLKNYADTIELLCFALLPNHFHLLLRQRNDDMKHFMNSLGTRYSMYFNKKYKRVGVLFQDVYKAVMVESDEQLLHLSRYIHLNSVEWLHIPRKSYEQAPFTNSLPNYLGKKITGWIKTDYILDHFSKTNPNDSYEDFILSSDEEDIIAHVAIDNIEENVPMDEFRLS